MAGFWARKGREPLHVRYEREVRSRRITILVILLLWAGALTYPTVLAGLRCWYAGGYRAATFEVVGVRYDPGQGGTEVTASPSAMYALGHVEGSTEVCELGYWLGMRSRTGSLPESQEELEKVMPVGTRLHVLYNPDRSMERVLPYQENLKLNSFLGMLVWGTIGWGPVLVVSLILRKKPSVSSIRGEAADLEGDGKGSSGSPQRKD